jgi:hypothetical protein
MEKGRKGRQGVNGKEEKIRKDTLRREGRTNRIILKRKRLRLPEALGLKVLTRFMHTAYQYGNCDPELREFRKISNLVTDIKRKGLSVWGM